MTVVLGLMLKEGIIIASDSQVEFSRGVPVRRVNANKIYRLIEDRNIAIAGAGILSFMHRAIDSIREEVNKRGKPSLIEIIDIAESVMASLHKMYNIERTRYLYGEERPQEELDATLIIGGYEERPHVAILFKEGISEPINDYATVGSGAAYAEYLLSKLYDSNMGLDTGVKVATYVIREVEKIDPNVGGPINIVKVSKEGYKELSHEEVENVYREFTRIDEVISRLWRKILGNEIEINKIQTLLGEDLR